MTRVFWGWVREGSGKQERGKRKRNSADNTHKRKGWSKCERDDIGWAGKNTRIRDNGDVDIHLFEGMQYSHSSPFSLSSFQSFSFSGFSNTFTFFFFQGEHVNRYGANFRPLFSSPQQNIAHENCKWYSREEKMKSTRKKVLDSCAEGNIVMHKILLVF